MEYKGERGWKVPPNLRIGKREIPIGSYRSYVLLTTALVNLFTKIGAHGQRHSVRDYFLYFHRFGARQQAPENHDELQMKEISSWSTRTPSGVRCCRSIPDAWWSRCAMLLILRAQVTLARTNTGDQDVVVLTARMVGAGVRCSCLRRISFSANTNRCYLPSGFGCGELWQTHLAAGGAGRDIFAARCRRRIRSKRRLWFQGFRAR